MSLYNYKIVDFTHKLLSNTPIWSEIPSNTVVIGETIIDYDEKGVEIQKFSFPGQFGTHVDFPAHFIRDAKRQKDYDIQNFCLPLSVIDVSSKIVDDCEYKISMDDIFAFEKKYGNIPSGSFVAMRSDWYKKWPDKINNVDVNNIEHCPGWSIEVLKYLFEYRKISAIGHETMDTDSSATIREFGYLCENYVLKNGYYQVELLCNLDKIPVIGAYILVLPLNVPEANGVPVRAVGIYK